MRIALTSENYHRVGGTETYVHTVAEQLQRLGHQVRVYSPRLGDMAQLTRGRGVDVVSRLEDLGEPDDVVLAQDAATSYELAGLWPEVPQVYVCHSNAVRPPAAASGQGDRPGGRGDEQTVEAPRGPHWTRTCVWSGCASRSTRSGSRPAGEPAARPRRALLLGNYLEGEARRLLVDTWSELGRRGGRRSAGNATPVLQPQDDIARADIVVGKGRAVLDAMSCGRPAYVYDVYGADGWVTPDTYDAIEADAIAGQALPGVVDADRLRADLAAYDPTWARPTGS